MPEVSEPTRPTPTALHRELGISVSYASLLLAKKKIPGLDLARRIYLAAGVKLGPIENASDEDIAALVRIAESAPPAPEGGGAQRPFNSPSPSSFAAGEEWPLTNAAE